MRIAVVVGLALVARVLAGCGGDGGPSATFDCAWLAGENCWKTTASMAPSCLPPETEQGVLSADNRMCAYPGGETVTFNPALQLPLPDAPLWNFTVTGADGQTCLHFEKLSSGSFTLVVQGQTYEEGASSSELRATCPDGSSYVLPLDQVDDIFNCPDAFGSLPGVLWSDSASGASFSLLATSSTSSEPVAVFSCYKAPS
jgi:hypothetical protein